MKYFITDSHLFRIETHDKIPSNLIGGIDYINASGFNNMRITHEDKFPTVSKYIESFYEHHVIYVINDNMKKVLEEFDLRMYVSKKKNKIMPVIQFVKLCKPYVLFRSKTDFLKFKLKYNY